MIQLVDETQSAWHTFASSDAAGLPFQTVVVKESYALRDDLTLERRPEPELITFADHYDGDPVATPMVLPSDVVPFKPRADIVAAARTYAPNGKDAATWPCGLRVSGAGGTVDAQLTATGPRRWLRKGTGWHLEDPEPARDIPVSYDLAFGGAAHLPTKQDPNFIEVLQTNPIGRGWTKPNAERNDEDVLAAPQLVMTGQTPPHPHDDTAQPAGLGPIAPAWLPRRPLGGTFDETWETSVAPNWPADYDFAFHNCAPRHLQLAGYLSGTEDITCLNLRPDVGTLRFTLPGTGLIGRLEDTQGRTQAIQLAADTLVLDLRPQWPGACLVAVTWRMVLPADGLKTLRVTRVPISSPDWSAARTPLTPADVVSQQEKVPA